MKKSKILELALLAGLPTSQPQRIYNFATYLANEAKKEREAKVVKEKGLTIQEWLKMQLDAKAIDLAEKSPEEVLPDYLHSLFHRYRGQEDKWEDKLWANWTKFYNYFTSADCRKPLKKDWPRAWINFITKG